MRFTSKRDYQTMLKINKELVNVVIDTTVHLFKIRADTATNSYGEATKKSFYSGVLIPALINRQVTNPVANMQTVDVEQIVEFAFLRKECEDRGIYPEVGDIVLFHSDYFEIDNINEVQLVAGQTSYNHQILCSAHLTRNTTLQLERPRT